MKRNKGNLKVATKEPKSPSTDFSDSIDEVNLVPRNSSGKKTYSKFGGLSPTKKSKQVIDQKEKPNKKFIRDIVDQVHTRLPHIPEHEIQECTIPEDLGELDRIKLLLSKENEDQQSYFFTNIENIFSIRKD
jgi:hypothetical protein